MLRQVSSAGMQQPRAGRGKPQRAIYALVRCCRCRSSRVHDCGPYPLSRGEGARLHHGGAVQRVLGQLLEASFPRPVCLSPWCWRKQGEGRNGGQGFPEVGYASWNLCRVVRHHHAAIRSTPRPMLASAKAHGVWGARMKELRRTRPPRIFSTDCASCASLGLFGGGTSRASALAPRNVLRPAPATEGSAGACLTISRARC
jgi:hypothetical protein